MHVKMREHLSFGRKRKEGKGKWANAIYVQKIIRKGYTSLLCRKHKKMTMNYYVGMTALFSRLIFSGQ